MIYTVTKSLMYAAVRGYFKKIAFIGKENLNYKKPTIYIINHPSALLDPLVSATAMKDKLHFIAAAEFFGHSFSSWILKSQFNMVPVYRPDVASDGKGNNDEMFRDCFDCLAKKGSIMIFPEGTSRTERRLRELKTGTMRIYHGAKRKLGDDFQIDIIPIGLNYTNPHQFQSRVLVSVGKPIDFKEMDYQVDWDETATVKAETLFIQSKLQKQIIHIENPRHEAMISNFEEILRFELWKEFGISKNDHKAKFNLQKQLVAGVEYAAEKNIKQLISLNQATEKYFRELASLKLSDAAIARKDIGKGTLFVFILLLPLALIGIIINLLPYLLSRWLFRSKILPKIANSQEQEGISPQFKGTLLFSLGTIIFILTYLIIATIAAYQFSFWVFPLTLLFCYLSALGTLRFFSAGYWLFRKTRRVYFGLFRKQELARLKKKRKAIIDSLQLIKSDYQGNI